MLGGEAPYYGYPCLSVRLSVCLSVRLSQVTITFERDDRLTWNLFCWHCFCPQMRPIVFGDPWVTGTGDIVTLKGSPRVKNEILCFLDVSDNSKTFWSPVSNYPFDPSHGPLRGGVGVIWDFAVKSLIGLFYHFFGCPPFLWNPWVARAMWDFMSRQYRNVCACSPQRREWGASTGQTFSDSFKVCFAPFSGTPVPMILWTLKSKTSVPSPQGSLKVR
jgi:hypothetical protein